MSNVLLEAFEVVNFRGFKHLKLEKLGRVNLIVGKNNVGKTSLLEALAVYAHRGSPSLIYDILESRDESSIKKSVEDQIEDIRFLFYGRPDIKKPSPTISLGSGSNHETLSMSIGWYTLEASNQGLRRLQSLPSSDFASVENLVPGLAVSYGAELESVYRLDRSFGYRSLSIPGLTSMNCIYVPAKGLDEKETEKYWDNITLTELQQQVIDSLRIIEPKLEGLNLIIDRNVQPNGRIPVVKLSGLNDRLPLKSLGEGMNRMFGISLALSNCAEGLLLIDEIESGLHYSIQATMWRLVIEMARRLNVQVFATTHSWDCIEGFQQATQDVKQEEGVLIRLGRKKEDIVATLYDEGELAIVTRDHIEVR